MNVNIPKLLQLGEGLTVEFIRATNKLPENLFETVCAFLNRNGGTIVLGIDDDKTIRGIPLHSIQILCKDIANLSNNPQKLFPAFLFDIQVVEYEEKHLIHLFIPASSQVHTCNGKIYDRNVDGDFEIKTSDQIRNLYVRKSNLYSENTIYPYLYETDFSVGVVERVRKIMRIYRPDHPWNELTNMEFFKIAGLYRRDLATDTEGFTMAALLLFGKEEVIGSAIPHYKVDALLRRVNTDRYDDRENIRCNLVEAYDRLMAFVAKHLPDKFYLQGDMRISLREKIFREVIANMLIHREYANAYPSTLTIYRNKLEIHNANRPHLYGLLTPDNFEPFPKNPHIAQIFTQIGRSEELGTGIRNVFKYTQLYSGSNHIVFQEEDVFVTVVPIDENVLYNGVDEIVGSDFTENQDSAENFTENFTENQDSAGNFTENFTENQDSAENFTENQDSAGNFTGNFTENFTENQDFTENLKMILKLMEDQPNISLSELSEIIGISRRAVINNTNKLKAKGLIEREGPDKGGYWKITKQLKA